MNSLPVHIIYINLIECHEEAIADRTLHE